MAKRDHARGFTLVELMVVIAIIGILAAIAAPKFQIHLISSRLETAKPYMASIASRLKETRNQYGSFLAGGESAYRGGGSFSSVTYVARSEQLLEDVLGVNLKDASDFCFRVQLGNALTNDADTSAKTSVKLADGEFEVWAVLRDTSGNAEAQSIDVVAGGTCVTAGEGTGTDEKLAPIGSFDSSIKGTIAVFKYPPPANNMYWTDGYRMDNPLGTALSEW